MAGASLALTLACNVAQHQAHHLVAAMALSVNFPGGSWHIRLIIRVMRRLKDHFDRLFLAQSATEMPGRPSTVRTSSRTTVWASIWPDSANFIVTTALSI